MDRKQYWDKNYLKYWEAKVNEANSDKEITINKNDVKTISDDLVFEYCNLVNLNKSMSVLDFGCGFCRCYPYFKSKEADYYGIDISEAMINESKKLYPELNDKLTVNEGEKLSFNSLYFDFVLCFGVFDACFQEDALKEMLRVLKKDGILLLTGKNNSYLEKDEKAFIAEKNARAKDHPNYFTDVKSMMKQLKEKGYSIENEFYFLQRGDFQEKKYLKEIPDRFYEYLLVIKKNNIESSNFTNFSDAYSNTFREKNV